MRKESKILNFKFQISEGFTLIELLIVMAIIGILSTLLMVNFIGIRQRARDAQRKSNIRQVQAALELYRADQGEYPTVAASPFMLNSAPCSSTGSTSLQVGSNIYMQKIPCDPSGIGWYNTGNYYYYSDGTTYELGACLENTNDSEKTGAPTRATVGGDCVTSYQGTYFIVKNP